MSLADIRMFLDAVPATPEQLELFREIRVDQAIGMASEAQLLIDLSLDDEGRWSVIEEHFIQPLRRIRVEVRIDEGEFTPLIDGPIVAQRFELGAAPAESTLTLIVHDDSVLLNLDEGVELFEDMPAHEIAQALISAAGLIAEVDSVAAAGNAHTRYTVRRGTAMQLLRDLARRHGMFVYVRPGDAPGRSVCVFARPSLQPGDAPELLLLGEQRNISKFSVQFDALQPTAARAGSVRIADKSLLYSQTDAAELTALGDAPVHGLLPATTRSLLSATREEQNDIDAATLAAVDMSSFAYTATAELDANDYAHCLAPHQIVSVAGPGGHLGGAYLISRVQHLISDASYKQNLTLKRNARCAGSSTSAAPGGIF